MPNENEETLLDALLYDNQEYLQTKENIFQKSHLAFMEEHLPLLPLESFKEKKSYLESYDKNYALAKAELNKKNTHKLIRYSFSIVAALMFITWIVFLTNKTAPKPTDLEIIANNANTKIQPLIQETSKNAEFSKYILPSNNQNLSSYVIKDQPIYLSKYTLESNSINSYKLNTKILSLDNYLINDQELYIVLNKGKFGYIKTKDKLILIAQNGNSKSQKFSIK